jgi:hypothetical protein
MLIYYILCVMGPNSLFGIGITARRVISAVALALLTLHCFLKPFLTRVSTVANR